MTEEQICAVLVTLSLTDRLTFREWEVKAALTGLPTRPMKRTYVLVEGKGLVDERLLPKDRKGKSAAIDPLVRGRIYHNIGPKPMFINSRSQLKAALQLHGRVEAG